MRRYSINTSQTNEWLGLLREMIFHLMMPLLVTLYPRHESSQHTPSSSASRMMLTLHWPRARLYTLLSQPSEFIQGWRVFPLYSGANSEGLRVVLLIWPSKAPGQSEVPGQLGKRSQGWKMTLSVYKGQLPLCWPPGDASQTPPGVGRDTREWSELKKWICLDFFYSTNVW